MASSAQIFCCTWQNSYQFVAKTATEGLWLFPHRSSAALGFLPLAKHPLWHRRRRPSPLPRPRLSLAVPLFLCRLATVAQWQSLARRQRCQSMAITGLSAMLPVSVLAVRQCILLWLELCAGLQLCADQVRALRSPIRALPVTCPRVGGLRRLEVCA